MLELAVGTDTICNKVVPVRAVTTIWLHLLLKRWCWSNTINNVGPELSSYVVGRQRLVLPGKYMPRFPRIVHIRLHSGVIGPI